MENKTLAINLFVSVMARYVFGFLHANAIEELLCLLSCSNARRVLCVGREVLTVV